MMPWLPLWRSSMPRTADRPAAAVDYWYVLALPLCLGISIVYKSIRCDSMRRSPRSRCALRVHTCGDGIAAVPWQRWYRRSGRDNRTMFISSTTILIVVLAVGTAALASHVGQSSPPAPSPSA